MPPDKTEGFMNQLPSNTGAVSPPEKGWEPAATGRQWRNFWLATLGLVLCFIFPLWSLAGFAVGSELYSYILLIPFISFYLIWQKRQNLPPVFLPARGTTAAFLAGGMMVILLYWLGLRHHSKLMEEDYLAVMMIALLLFFWAVCSWCLGRQFLRVNVFAISFLVFMVPIPTAAIRGIDAFLQSGSAAVARGFFMMSGTPFLQDGLVFQLPGITIQIAPECSGIHSSLVLFITSLIASHFFLRTPWKRVLFVVAVIPLAILRNGFRVFTIGELCVHIGPHMINSPIHRKGGPLFFALSLIPLFLLLVVLQKSELVGGRSKTKSRENPTPKSPE
jgi:exosortase C (VPDSG-CTERM-specific)